VDVSKCFERSDLETLWGDVCSGGANATSPNGSDKSDSWVNVEAESKPAAAPRQETQPQKAPQGGTNPSRNREAAPDFSMNQVMMFVLFVYLFFGSTIMRAMEDIMGGGKSYVQNPGDAADYDGNDDFIRGKVREVFTKKEFDDTLAYHSESTGLPVIVDFYSPSCGPCQMVAPVFKQMAMQYKGRAAFMKVNTNVNYQAASAYRVHALPTFLFFLNAEVQNRLAGYNPQSLHQSVGRVLQKAKDDGYYLHVDNKGVMHAGRVSASKLQHFYHTHTPLPQPEKKNKENDPDNTDSENENAVKSPQQIEAIAQKYQGRVNLLMRRLKKKYGAVPQLDGVSGVEAFANTLPIKLEEPNADHQGKDNGPSTIADTKSESLSPQSSGAETVVHASSKQATPYAALSTLELRKVLAQVQAELNTRPENSVDLRAKAEAEEQATEADAALQIDPSRLRTVTNTKVLPKGTEYKVVVVGGGPAGLAAALYAARSGLQPLLIAPSGGGQLLGKGVDVENYPGVVEAEVGAEGRATGKSIVRVMRKQAHSFNTTLLNAKVKHVDTARQTGGPLKLHVEVVDAVSGTPKVVTILASAVVVATGANSKWLGIQGEERFKGGGVSACATCDGFLFKGKPVIVVGGGDTAMEDALVLARTSASVILIHRRDNFRASKILAQRVLAHEKIAVRWNTVVTEFVGKDNQQTPQLTSVKVRDVKTGKSGTIEASAAFVAIGHDPNTAMFKDVLKMDDQGYLITKTGSTKTNVDGVFAAGDVADKVYRQAVTSAGTGAMAALDAERWLSEEGLGM